MENAVIKLDAEILSALVIHGDLSKLTNPQLVQYYRVYCERLKLDPATQPFKLLRLNGKLVMYCDRGGAAQLCKLHEVSHKILSRSTENDLFIVTAQASVVGRQTESIGAVDVTGLKRDALANAMMKAETKAKRRATLDLLGLGMLDETETGTIPGAVSVPIEIVEPAQVSTNPQEVQANAAEESKEDWALRQLRRCANMESLDKVKDELQKRGHEYATKRVKEEYDYIVKQMEQYNQ